MKKIHCTLIEHQEFIFHLWHNKNDGTVLVAGLRSVDLEESVGDDNHFVRKVFSSIKNLTSDRCATHKKSNKIFTEFQFSLLDIVSNCGLLASEHQQTLIIIGGTGWHKF